MAYTISQLAEATGVQQSGSGNGNVERLLIDSRSLVQPEGTLFIALKTATNDGHKYIAELYRRGVRLFLVKDGFDTKTYKDASFITAPDTLNTLQKIAAWHRNHFNLPVIAITGSNGKTIVKEWLYQLLSPGKKIVRSPRSYNSQVGVPLSVWQIDNSHHLGIFEAGISQPGEMDNLQPIIKPTVGLFTNIGEAHGQNFNDSRQKINEKLKLFVHAETLIYCCDYKEIDEEIKKNKSLANVNLFRWSKKVDADFKVDEIIIRNGTTLTARVNGKNISIHIPFTDEASVENAIHCWAYMVWAGYDNSAIAKRMNRLQPVAMRMEMIEGMNDCTIINDVYNSDITSLSVALDFLNQQQSGKDAGHGASTLILSDIMQGGEEEEVYRKVAGIINSRHPSRLIGIGETISKYAGAFNIEKHFFKSTDDFLLHLPGFNFHHETILVKGARSFGFERISKQLQQKSHETVLQINLNSLVHNLNYFRSQIKPGVKIMAMVKAFSYGSGSFEIANVLQYHKTDYLAVAYTDEGVELRTSGISLPVMVMNPEPGAFDTMINYRLEPEIYSFHVLNMALKANQPLSIHIKLDTGMHRLGFGQHEINKLVKELKKNPQLNVASVFSHLAASDADKHREFTLLQINRFNEMSETIIELIGKPITRHILNSAGIVRYPEAQFDMVRLGIGLYGVGVNEIQQKKLENVSTLKTTISQINHFKKGETIGYNRHGLLKKDSVIATVAIGYADGYGRELGNGKGIMHVNGKPAPVVGDVCMDMCMIDITGIKAHEGDEVIIFDTIQELKQMAENMNTIPYEALTGLSGRVKRIYTHE